jgi:hypothetical protein
MTPAGVGDSLLQLLVHRLSSGDDSNAAACAATLLPLLRLHPSAVFSPTWTLLHRLPVARMPHASVTGFSAHLLGPRYPPSMHTTATLASAVRLVAQGNHDSAFYTLKTALHLNRVAKSGAMTGPDPVLVAVTCLLAYHVARDECLIRAGCRPTSRGDITASDARTANAASASGGMESEAHTDEMDSTNPIAPGTGGAGDGASFASVYFASQGETRVEQQQQQPERTHAHHDDDDDDDGTDDMAPPRRRPRKRARASSVPPIADSRTGVASMAGVGIASVSDGPDSALQPVLDVSRLQTHWDGLALLQSFVRHYPHDESLLVLLVQVSAY